MKQVQLTLTALILVTITCTGITQWSNASDPILLSGFAAIQTDVTPQLRISRGTLQTASTAGLSWGESSLFGPNEKFSIYLDYSTQNLYLGPDRNRNNAHITITDDDRLGINIASPNASLDIQGDGVVSQLRLRNGIQINDITTDGEGNLTFLRDGSTTTMVINDNTGNIGIGTGSNPAYRLEVAGSLGISGEFTAISDKRLKKDIVPLTNALIMIQKLNPVSYFFNTDKYEKLHLPHRRKIGMIAQEVETLLPEIVTTVSSEYDVALKSINYIEIIPLLVKAIQEQQEIIDYLTMEVEKLKN